MMRVASPNFVKSSLFTLAALALALPASSAQAQITHIGRAQREIAATFAGIETRLQGDGYHRVDPPQTPTVVRSSSAGIARVIPYAGEDSVWVAVCDSNCRDVSLSAKTAGAPTSPADANTDARIVELAASPQIRASLANVEVKGTINCATRPCFYEFRQYRRGAVHAVTLPTPPTPSELNQARETGLSASDALGEGAQELGFYYPLRAQQEMTEGRVTLQCLVEADFHYRCRVLQEDPAGWQFGDAALRFMSARRAPDQDGHGASSVGERQQFALSFRLR